MWWFVIALLFVLWLDNRHCIEFKKHKRCIKELHERVEVLEEQFEVALRHNGLLGRRKRPGE